MDNLPELALDYLMRHSRVIFVRMDEQMHIVEANRGFLDLLGMLETPYGKDLSTYLRIERKEPESADPALQPLTLEVCHAPDALEPVELVYVKQAGAGVRLNGMMSRLDGGAVLFAEHIRLNDLQVVERLSRMNVEMGDMTRDIHRQKALLEEKNRLISRMASHDVLTGVGNRRLFRERFEGIRSGMEKGLHDGLVLLMSDLDDFKGCNDRYGHDAGDRVLQSFARTLRDHTRDGDTVVRFGGDEFGVLLPDVTLDVARERAQAMAAAFLATDVAGVPVPPGASFGLTRLHHEDSLDDFLQRADQALYRAKRSHKGTVVVWEEMPHEEKL